MAPVQTETKTLESTNMQSVISKGQTSNLLSKIFPFAIHKFIHDWMGNDVIPAKIYCRSMLYMINKQVKAKQKKFIWGK